MRPTLRSSVDEQGRFCIVTQPTFVPITNAEKVRPAVPQPVPGRAVVKDGQVRVPSQPTGALLGDPGPDQGYALLLAHRASDRLVLRRDEDRHDVEVGAALLAGRRASMFGRAPSIYDIDVALGLFGYLGDAPEDLVEYRRALFQSIGHSYAAQRALVDSVPEAALRVTPAQAASLATDWRSTLDA